MTSSGQTMNTPDFIKSSRVVTARNITVRMQETLDSQAVTLAGNGETIPSNVPVIVVSSSTGRTGLILAPPPDATIDARLTVVNTSDYTHSFDSDNTSNVANAAMANLEVRSASQFNWIPAEALWYNLRNLT